MSPADAGQRQFMYRHPYPQIVLLNDVDYDENRYR